MSYGRKLKTDLENLLLLHRINRIYNSPKTIRKLDNYADSDNNSISNYKHTIFLQRTNPVSYFPVCIKILKRKNNYSYSPNKSIFNSPSHSRINNNSFANFSFKKGKYDFNYEQNRTRNKMNNDNDTFKYRNMGQINKLKNSLGNPKQARNVMVTNIGRSNRFISISPSQKSNKEEIKDKTSDYLKYNEINIEENKYEYDGKHKMRYLLSKDYISKLKKINQKKLKTTNNTYNNRTNSLRNNKKIINDKDVRNMECSPENKSNISGANDYQVKTGNRIITNIKAKNLTPQNITPILNSSTPYIVPEDQIIQEEIQLSDYNNNNNINQNNIFLNNKNYSSYKIVEIKLDDLIFIEGRLNDIILSLNNKKNIFDIGAINESVEFLVFYYHSSLKDKLTLFFLEPNRLIIKSSFNLNLFIIMITYHLSLNPSMLVKVILFLKQIYNLLKMNLFLFIRKIELYYGDEFCSKNEIYFKTCNYFLNENGLSNIYENEIINIINNNCISIVKDVSNILNYYQNINNKYYYDFNDIFLNISRINEQDISNYFYNNLFNSNEENMIAQKKNNNINYTIDNFENNNFVSPNKNFNDYTFQNIIQNQSFIEQENEQYFDDIILKYKRNKEIPPFLKNRNPKRYTLVLDLEDTLISVKISDDGKVKIHPRPGLISFLIGIKPYYEIISFSKLSKNYSSAIIQQIEEGRKLFDYNLYREHCILVGRKFIKDISRIGRDMKKIIMVDDLPENINVHLDNGILILPYDGNYNKEDKVLYELKKMLILFYNLGYEDLRNALKSYKNEIYERITLGLAE